MLFTEYPLVERFAAAKKAGFDAIEIQFPYDLDVDILKQLQKQHDIKIILINVNADDLLTGGEGLACVPSKQAKFDEAMTLCLHYAQHLQVECVNVLPGRCFDDSRRNDYLRTFKHNLNNAADFLSAINVKCTFEAINTVDMPAFLIDSPEQMLAVITELAHPNIYMQYDIYHMANMGRDLCSDLHQFGSYIGHIQFADCPGRHEPGTGSIDFNAVFNAIEDITYDGWVSAEYKPSDTTEKSLVWYKN